MLEKPGKGSDHDKGDDTPTIWVHEMETPQNEMAFWAEIRGMKNFPPQRGHVNQAVDDGHQTDGHHDHRYDGLADQAA